MKELVNLEAETRNGFYIDEKMKRVWNVELDLLEKLLEVCNKYNLRCYADAGTLLGAVRHKGFIPWDDDIDVVMFRNDYDKLLEIASEEFKEPYFLQTAYSDINYIRGHAQLRNSQTTAILNSEKDYNFQFNQGIFLDIFVLDGVTDNKLKLEKQRKRIQKIKVMLYRHIYQKYSNTIKEKILHCFENVFFKIVPYKTLYKYAENIFRKESIEECQNVAPLNFIFETEKRIRNKDLYEKIVMLDFEGLKIPAPAEYDVFLKKRYGDYRKPVQIPTTHGEVFFDPDNSYKKYIN